MLCICAAHISDGLIQLGVISRTEFSQHLPLSGSITLPWRCEALQGAVEVQHELLAAHTFFGYVLQKDL